MKKIFLFLLAPVFAAAQPPAQEFKIKGELKSFKPVDKVYISYRDGENNVRDSFQLTDGSFKYESKLTEPTVATLVIKYVKQEGEERAKQEGVQFFLEPGKISIDAKDSLKANTIKGGAGQADFEKLSAQSKQYDSQFKALFDNYSKTKAAGDKEALKTIEKQIDALDKDVKDKVYGSFIKSNPNSPLALYALKQYAGWDIDANKIEPLFASLPASVQQWNSAKDFKGLLDIAKKTGIGQYAMNFTQNDTLGNAVSLSSFKGKYLLVDFWASWCGPCRQENPNVVKAFNKYKDKNFTILGVSLDRPNAKDKWMKAIHDDNLTWNHVSDLKFWDNEVAKQYGIKAIPQNILIDPQGKIIAKNLSGEELDKKLEEVLPK